MAHVPLCSALIRLTGRPVAGPSVISRAVALQKQGTRWRITTHLPLLPYLRLSAAGLFRHHSFLLFVSSKLRGWFICRCINCVASLYIRNAATNHLPISAPRHGYLCFSCTLSCTGHRHPAVRQSSPTSPNLPLRKMKLSSCTKPRIFTPGSVLANPSSTKRKSSELPHVHHPACEFRG